MGFYWVIYCIKQDHFCIFWKLGKDDFADYFTKRHPASHHRVMIPIYIQIYNTQYSSINQGCVNSSRENLRVKLTWKLTLLAQRNVGTPK